MLALDSCCCVFLCTATTATEIYALSLHDALPICVLRHQRPRVDHGRDGDRERGAGERVPRTDDAPGEQVHGKDDRADRPDRKSTRLNSSHTVISYAVFCLKKKI